MTPTGIAAATWIIFALVYFGLAVGKLPFVHLDRAGIALVGATVALVLGIITFRQAVDAVDFSTIALLFGMMVVVAYLRLGGSFGCWRRASCLARRRPSGCSPRWWAFPGCFPPSS